MALKSFAHLRYTYFDKINIVKFRISKKLSISAARVF